jgi:hypothetical protein
MSSDSRFIGVRREDSEGTHQVSAGRGHEGRNLLYELEEREQDRGDSSAPWCLNRKERI